MSSKEGRLLYYGLSFSQILLLLGALFAFCFFLNQESALVSAQSITPIPANPTFFQRAAPGVFHGPVAGGVATSFTAGSTLTAGTAVTSGTLSAGAVSFQTAAGSVVQFSAANGPITVGAYGGQAGTFVVQQGATTYVTGAAPVVQGSAVASTPVTASAPGATASGGTITSFIQNLFSGKATFGLSGTGGAVAGALAQGLVWGILLYGVGKMLGPLFGLSKENTDALSKSLLLGGVSGGVIKAFLINANPSNPGLLGLSAGQAGFLGGVVIFAIVFILLYSDKDTQLVNFQCLPWEPPLGGANCESCNKDALRPCSEYRCKSLGQACDLVNKGTEKEQCVWVSKGDVTSPTITPNVSALTSGLNYVPLLGRPTALGTKIVKNNGCLPAFTKLQFGLDTNEPAQCRLDYENKNYSELQFFVGGSNYYTKSHVQEMRLPSPTGSDSPLFKNDGTFDLYVRCQDANGNKNEDVYVVEYCVDKGPDTTPPLIEKTSIISGSPVRYKVDAVPLEIYTNEPAQCKWSRQDKAYDSMENAFACVSSPQEINAELLYTCSGTITGIENNKNNEYYLRCRDAAGNTNVQSQPDGKAFVLKGSQPLSILSIEPNATVFGSTSVVSVQLQVTTDDGSSEGKALCFYNSSLTGGYQAMFESNSFKHMQLQQLGNGTYQYFFKCVDAGGNVAEASTSFAVIIDKSPPQVTRAYKDQALKIVTNEDAECTYSLTSCNFNLKDGLKMEYANPSVKNALFAPWKPQQTYYIKCVDRYGNQPSDPNECSVVVSPRQLGQS